MSAPAQPGAQRWPARPLGVVLAGGRGARMGSPKALLPWGDAGEPLVLTVARTLTAIAAEVVVAAGSRTDVAEAVAGRYAALADAGELAPGEESIGPLGGLARGLEHGDAAGHWAVVALSCDMPLVRPEDLVPLLDALVEGADAAFYRIDGHDQPLCAAYRRVCVGGAREALARGGRRVVALLAPETGHDFRVARLDPPRNSAQRLMNVNTPSDYDRARAFPS